MPRQSKPRPSLALLAVLLAGCAAAPPPPPPTPAVPGETLAPATLQRETRDDILRADQARAPECAERRIVSTELLETPDDTEPTAGGRGKWIERWSVDRCGTTIHYLVEFLPVGQGDASVRTTVER